MNAKFLRSLFLLWWVLFAVPAFAQSLPFKALLNTTYEKDFPLVYPEQKDLLEDAVILDSREQEEFSVSHLEDARWVGYETFSMA
ncbi:MAG: rhodanese-like domain-containing protein, partial [Cyclobacteriaceae bacterium]